MAEPEVTRRPLRIWAHQGGAREGPSNTLEAMARAMASGADAIELDVHRTADRVLVVCHDARIDRTTNGQGPFSELSLDRLQQFDAAYFWTDGRKVDHRTGRPPGAFPLRWTGHPSAALPHQVVVPTLRDVLATYAHRCPLTIELKGRHCETALADLLHEVLGPGQGTTIDVTVVSFWGGRVRRFAQAFAAHHGPNPADWRGVATAPGTGFLLWFWFCSRFFVAPRPRLLGARRLQMVHRFHGLVMADRRFVRAAHDRGLLVDAWTVDDPAQLERLLTDGVDGVMTDSPALIARALARRRSTEAP